jgi:hypothetical protein
MLDSPCETLSRRGLIQTPIHRQRTTTTVYDNTSWNRLGGSTAIPHAPASGIVVACLEIQVRIVH